MTRYYWIDEHGEAHLVDSQTASIGASAGNHLGLWWVYHNGRWEPMSPKDWHTA